MKILVGADPELFVRDTKTQEYISAHNLIPGTKLEPYKVPNGAIQVDGAAAEFNIDPAETSAEFITNISAVMKTLAERCSNSDLIIEPVVEFKKEYFNTLPPSVRELGCNPDYNAWTGKVNPAPDGDSTTMRTASGHIHVGWQDSGVNPFEENHFSDCCKVIQQLDYYLGLPSLWWDPDNRRRSLYGKAGAFRPKSYGAEYRTLSNVWLASMQLQKWIFNVTVIAVSQLAKTESMTDKFGDFAREMIDSNNVDWYKTPTGRKVWGTLNISQPPYVEVTKPENRILKWKQSNKKAA